MRLYFCDISAVDDDGPFLSYLSEGRREYCLRLKNLRPRLESVFSYLLLRYSLIKDHGFDKVPEFVFNEYTKPFLKERPDIFFSMSHAHGAVICAVEKGSSIGADIQDVRKISLNAAKKFCTSGELEALSAMKDESLRIRELCRLWSMKESYSKKTGKGFSEGFGGIDCEKLVNTGEAAFAEYRGYFVSVCTEAGAFPSAVPVAITPEEIAELVGRADNE